MDLSKLTLGDKIVGGTAIALIIDLLFLPWHKVTVSFLGASASSSRTAVQSPNSFFGILALLLVIAVLVVLILDRLTTVELPKLPVPMNAAIFYATGAVLALLVLKLIFKFEYLGFASYVGILIAAGMTYGGFLLFQTKDSASPSSGGSSNTPPTPF